MTLAHIGVAFAGLAAPRATTVTARHASGTPQEPWKPVVFKMPKKRPPREVGPDGDDYTIKMRERLRGLKVDAVKDFMAERTVADTKFSDLVNIEADNAKIAGLNTMWYMDRYADKAKAEEETPDARVLRSKYDVAMDKLNGVVEKKEETKIRGVLNGGYLNMASVQDIDEMFAQARAAPVKKQEQSASSAVEEEEEEEESIADWIEAQQKQSATKDKVSKRVVKSPAQRKEDYEETKDNLFLTTGALGVVGAVVSFALFGLDTAFSFGVGSLGALYYLNGLAAYSDSAEKAQGGPPRLLVPVILVLVVVQWEKLCYYAPALTELHLHPEILPVLMGFFTYVIGKVASSLVPSKRVRGPAPVDAAAD